MEFGAAMFFTDYAMDAGAFARALEERGFDSVWAPEHSHIPVSRQTPFPQGGELPRKYAECMDPFVSLTLAAAMTKTIKLGTGVCLVVQRDPIQTAKLVASLDQVSRGRFLFGIGGGWNAEEMADHGTTDFKGRWKLVRERVEAMKAIWTQETPEYHGSLVDFGPMLAWPKPVQKPHPPVIVGGAFPYGARRAIAYGEGWVPHGSRPHYGDVGQFLPEFFKMAREAGRAPASLPVTLFGIPADLDRLRYYRDAGVARVVVSLNSAGADDVLPRLDQWAELMRGGSPPGSLASRAGSLLNARLQHGRDPTMDLGLKGKKAIVCAASKGLGKACAMSLARDGVEVFITARTASDLEATAAEIRAATGSKVIAVPGDITTDAGRAAVLAACPNPDILVNNAGGPPRGDFRDWNRDDWIKAVDANMLTPIFLIKAVVDGMIERKFGRIVNITSASVKSPIPELGMSNGARAGLTGFVAGLARQIAKHNVIINNILPGPFLTDRLRGGFQEAARTSNRPVDELVQERAKTSYAGRVGDPAEFGDACAFLCSAKIGFIVGHNLILDGGAFNSSIA